VDGALPSPPGAADGSPQGGSEDLGSHVLELVGLFAERRRRELGLALEVERLEVERLEVLSELFEDVLHLAQQNHPRV